MAKKRFDIHEWQANQIKKRLTEQNDDQVPDHYPPNWKEYPGYNPDAFYGPDSVMNKMKGKPSQESMSNATIKALQVAVSDYSLNTILTRLAVIVDQTGKHDEADMIKKLADQIENLDPSAGITLNPTDMDENTTGGGASFNAGNGEGYATPNAFKKKNKED